MNWHQLLFQKMMFMTAKVKHSIYPCAVLSLFFSSAAIAQLPVSEEPMHRNVFQNKYIRLLDVWLQPGDTTMYHIHATPSLFVYLSNAATASQIKGEEWVKGQATAGTAWYRSFSPDILVHRVCNLDTVPFHVNDIEILSSYDSNNLSHNTPLPFTVLFENEKAFAYQLTRQSFKKQTIHGRGPMIAELVSGEGLFFHDVKTNQAKEIKAGKYMYIEPGVSFYFTARGTGEINMVVFELK